MHDLDGSRVADAAEVVAGEVDQHEVLGALLLVVPELLGERVILGAVATALARARDRLQRRDRPSRVSETCVSGDAETICSEPKSANTMYGEGFTARSAR